MKISFRPKKRSKLRLFFGRIVYRFLRYMYWFFSRTKFSTQKLEPESYQSTIFHHRSLLYRQLSNVDMWLQRNKVANLRLAVAKLDGIVVRPGETFSFWKLVGKPTKSKGYLEGMVLCNGAFEPGAGGGLCQLSNLIYWMTLHTPLNVVERWRHSYDVFPDSDRTQPFGSGATVAYNHIDLQIKNDTQQNFIMHVYLTEEYLIGEWRSDIPISYKYEVYEKSHEITHEIWGGYMRRNKIHRRVFDLSGKLLRDELVTENEAIMMYQPYLPEARGHHIV